MRSEILRRRGHFRNSPDLAEGHRVATEHGVARRDAMRRRLSRACTLGMTVMRGQAEREAGNKDRSQGERPIDGFALKHGHVSFPEFFWSELTVSLALSWLPMRHRWNTVTLRTNLLRCRAFGDHAFAACGRWISDADGRQFVLVSPTLDVPVEVSAAARLPAAPSLRPRPLAVTMTQLPACTGSETTIVTAIAQSAAPAAISVVRSISVP